MNKDVLCSDCPARWPDTRLRAVPDAEPRERAGTVAHFEGNGPSVTGVIWVNQPKPSPGTAVYLSPARPSFDAGLSVREISDVIERSLKRHGWDVKAIPFATICHDLHAALKAAPGTDVQEGGA